MLQLTLLLAMVMWSPAAAVALSPINITLERGEAEFDRMLMTDCKNPEVASFWKEMLLKWNKSTPGKASPQTNNSSKIQHLHLHLLESTSQDLDNINSEMRQYQGMLYSRNDNLAEY